MADINDKSTGRMVVLNFAQDNAPIVKEYGGKDYIGFGEKNDYSDFIIGLYNRSAKHGAIINGKVNYIIGGGIGKETPAPGFIEYKDAAGVKVLAQPVNAAGETMDEVMKKCALDVEIHGGFRLFVIWKKAGSCELYHVEFQKIKTGKEPGTYYYKQSWAIYKKDDVIKPYVEFNPNKRTGCQVFAYNEYRPGCDKYPLPGYTGAIDYIQADIEVGAHTYGNASGGFTASKMISYFNGDPGEEGARIIERQLTNKFTGRKGKKFVLSFQTDVSKKPQIDDLGASDLTKEDFTAIDSMIEQNIFAGHSITSPALFGIKTAGQLGGNTELQTAYAIFTNTYAKPKQKDYTRLINYFGELMGMGNDYFIQPLEPIGLQIDIKDVVNSMPKEFVFDYFNVPKEMRELPNIGADNKPVGTPAAPEPVAASAEQLAVNTHVKNLTGRQRQVLEGYINRYKSGKAKREYVAFMLKSGYGFTDEDIDILLGDEPQAQFSKTHTDDEVVEMFAAFGEFKSDYEAVRSKKVGFSRVEEAETDEKEWLQNFRDTSLTASDQTILDLIKKDKLVTPEVIAKALKTNKAYVVNRLKKLEDRGLIEHIDTKVGEDTQVERSVTPEADIKTVKGPGDGEGLNISVKYEYNWKKIIPVSQRNTAAHPSRPFCVKLMELDRYYTRTEIETISQALGYSVFDRKGGFWNNKGKVEEECRHNWYSVILVKKGGNKA